MSGAEDTKEFPMRLLGAQVGYGYSTGWDKELRGNFEAAVADATARSTGTIEISSLSETQLPALEAYLAANPKLPHYHVSIHGPSKDRELPEPELVARLAKIAEREDVDGIVMHPETMLKPKLYKILGAKLRIENMDARRADFRTATELAPIFKLLPEARLCLDVAHVYTVDPSLVVGYEILDAYGDRLAEVHVSGIDEGCHHRVTTDADLDLYEPLLRRCVTVPWILESSYP
jgi:hypothetical protein